MKTYQVTISLQGKTLNVRTLKGYSALEVINRLEKNVNQKGYLYCFEAREMTE